MTNHIVLYKPQIPPNTGNVARTCAGTNTHLHLIEPLGFSTSDRALRRAGLDYWHELNLIYHRNLRSFLEYAKEGELYLVSKFASKMYTDINYKEMDKDYYFIFGKETTGLPEKFMREYKENCIRIPMSDKHVRSLNLSNTANIIIYEALRQQNFHSLDLTYEYKNNKLQ